MQFTESCPGKESAIFVFRRFFFLCSFAVAILAVYQLQLADSYAFRGYTRIEASFLYFVYLFASIFFCTLLSPPAVRHPSDFFCTIYTLVVLIPYAVLYRSRGEVDVSVFVLQFIVLAFPAACVRASGRCPIRFSPMRVINIELIAIGLAIACLWDLAYAVAHAPSSAGFDLSSSYIRRLEGREIFRVGTLAAYANSAIVNGFAPFLAFYAGWRNRGGYLIIALAVGTGFFYVIGLKAPLAYILSAYIVGHGARKGRIQRIDFLLIILLNLLLLASVVEMFIFDFSYIADYIIRRVFAVPPYIMSAYFDFIDQTMEAGWSAVDGITSDIPVPFIVGEQFLMTPGLNANTNTFVYQLANGGIIGYLVTVALIVCIFMVIDSIYRHGKSAAFLYLGFSYSLLLTEQAATTALVSSGIGVLLILLALGKSRIAEPQQP